MPQRLDSSACDCDLIRDFPHARLQAHQIGSKPTGFGAGRRSGQYGNAIGGQFDIDSG
jgi:hypothetical protein